MKYSKVARSLATVFIVMVLMFPGFASTTKKSESKARHVGAKVRSKVIITPARFIGGLFAGHGKHRTKKPAAKTVKVQKSNL